MSGVPATSGPDFLIVGSPRSGTTLVQRLACELPGVAMPPETHFFDLFVPGLLRRGAPPLDGARLAAEIAEWRRMEQVRGIDIDVDAVVGELGGHCNSLMQFFGVLVRHLVTRAERYGEKTPDHLWWWRPLTGARPTMKVVAVVRDPRASVSSRLAAPWAADTSDWHWGKDLYVAMAERWRVEQEQLLLMAQELGSRCVVLRYEDVVADPPRARSAIAELIGRDGAPAPVERPGLPPIVLPWETWKADALAEVHARRVDAWKADLGQYRARVVSAICAPVMDALGYGRAARERLGDAMAASMLSPLTQRRRRAYRRQLLDKLDWINRVAV